LLVCNCTHPGHSLRTTAANQHAGKPSPFGTPQSPVYPESHLPSSARRFFLLTLLTEGPAFPMMRTNGGIGKPTLISTTTRLFSGAPPDYRQPLPRKTRPCSRERRHRDAVHQDRSTDSQR